MQVELTEEELALPKLVADGEKHVGNLPVSWDNSGKPGLIPNDKVWRMPCF